MKLCSMRMQLLKLPLFVLIKNNKCVLENGVRGAARAEVKECNQKEIGLLHHSIHIQYYFNEREPLWELNC